MCISSYQFIMVYIYSVYLMSSELNMSFYVLFRETNKFFACFLARYGVYHMLISALPSIAPRLDKLRNGTMQVRSSAAWGMSSGRLPFEGLDIEQ